MQGLEVLEVYIEPSPKINCQVQISCSQGFRRPSAFEGQDCPSFTSNSYVSHHGLSELTILSFTDRSPQMARMVRSSNKFYTEQSSVRTKLKLVCWTVCHQGADSPPFLGKITQSLSRIYPKTFFTSGWSSTNRQTVHKPNLTLLDRMSQHSSFLATFLSNFSSQGGWFAIPGQMVHYSFSPMDQNIVRYDFSTF